MCKAVSPDKSLGSIVDNGVRAVAVNVRPINSTFGTEGKLSPLEGGLGVQRKNKICCSWRSNEDSFLCVALTHQAHRSCNILRYVDVTRMTRCLCIEEAQKSLTEG